MIDAAADPILVPRLIVQCRGGACPAGLTEGLAAGLELECTRGRVLSNLETHKEKLLQIVLVGQLNLKDLLRSSDLRQLDQRVSIRYELKPLTREETSAYIAHRLTIAGGGAGCDSEPVW